jgi:tight adherence protein C
MSRLFAVPVLVGFVGLVLVFGDLPWFTRRAVAGRLRPYTPGGHAAARSTGGVLSVESFRDAVVPLAQIIGRRLSQAFGIHEDLGRRLERIHSPLDATQYRMRQFGRMAASAAAAVALSAALRVPVPVALFFAAGAPVLAFLVLEQRAASASAERQRRLIAELPVASEQLGMLLGAGYSLGAALQRIARRANGVCSEDLALVSSRVGHGLSVIDALREWADLADVEPLHRLVAVLALDREAGDLSRLIAEEARSIRRDAHRRLIEDIERRSQQVWIPVTVAALVPGVIFLAVPFVRALSLFSAG